MIASCAAALGFSWALSLDRMPVGPAYLGPPPGSPESRDVPTERLRWRQLLSQRFDGEGRLYGPEREKVRQMLALLNQAQEAADEVWAHTLNGSGGPQ
jgi:hypothetical protein